MDEQTIGKAIKLLKQIRNRILALKLVFIELDTEEDAYLIFETLNTRGRDLTTPDLVKNLLLKLLRTSNVTYDSPKIIWNDILERFENYGIENGMDSFLYHHWLSKYNFVTEKKLFGEINKIVKSKEDAIELLNEFKINSKFYISIFSPANFMWKKEEIGIKKCLESLKLFRVKQQIPMTLSLSRAYKEKKISLKMFHNALKDIESFHFIFNAISQQRSSGTISSLYCKHAIDLTKTVEYNEIQSILKSLKNALKAKLPEYPPFESGFNNLCFTNKKTHQKNLIKYILMKFMGETINGVPVDYTRLTLEHLAPQSEIDEVETMELIGSIGNIILVDDKINSNYLENHSFKIKKEILLKNNYPVDSFLKDAEEWGSTEINKRQKWLCHDAYHKIWRI